MLKHILHSFLLFSLTCISQNETNNWYFGNYASLNFANHTVTPQHDSNMDTPEGCSSISDHNGNLLFYTNGQTVWSWNHEIMENGEELAGDPNHTQSCIIVPKPNHEGVYYVFTTRVTPSGEFNSGVYYSVVEFSSSNSLGEVTSKNNYLTQSSSEKISAIHHTETNSIKVMFFAGLNNLETTPINSFFICKVDENGLYIETITATQQVNFSPKGSLKISPNGKYIAVVDYGVAPQHYVHLYHLDLNENSISHATTIFAGQGFHGRNPYGVEFSQDSKILYYTSNTSSTSYLFKFSMDDIPEENEVPSPTLVKETAQLRYASLQLARNGKIYVSTSSPNKIGVINNPETPDADCGFEELSIDLSPEGPRKGLPNFVTSFLRNRIITRNDCVSSPINFIVDTYAPIESIFWDFGDGTTDTSMTPSHLYSEPGHYVVEATISINNHLTTLYESLEVYPIPDLQPGEFLSQCDLDNDEVSYFNLNNIEDKLTNPVSSEYNFDFYTSYDDLVNQTNEISNPGQYLNLSNPQEIFVSITSAENCTSSSSFFIQAVYTDLGDISPMYSCENSDDNNGNDEALFNLIEKGSAIRDEFDIPESYDLTYYQSFIDAQTTSNPISLFFESSSTTIWVRVSNNEFDCFAIEPIELIVNPEMFLDLQDSYTICDPSLQPPIVLDGGSTNDYWEWSDSSGNILSNQRFFEVNQTGTFTITVYTYENNIECSLTKTFTIDSVSPPSFVGVSSDNNQISVTVSGNSVYEFSLDGNNYEGQGSSYTFNDVDPGLYTVYVRDLNNCEPTITTEVSLIKYPKILSPNGDNYNDYWHIQGLSEELYLWVDIGIYDRYGKVLFIMDLDSNNNIGWNGIYNGKKLNATDYWFKAILMDKNNKRHEKTGHFSLVR
ncbi:T9SS type B sorting domain-containing protein [Mangrovimonas aestuarii]|uniref:T9SS type B sorting domain-containing protein n=1 Tax=Mangrovimonas aestuarii TaxID=3018443 RepID=UPI0023791216|nr:T9SS type B sorting domain-containing protein [Mangrovimonas aestuarii]